MHHNGAMNIVQWRFVRTMREPIGTTVVKSCRRTAHR